MKSLRLNYFLAILFLNGCGVGLYTLLDTSGGGSSNNPTLSGVVDPNFGVSGIATTVIGTSGNSARVLGIVIDSDGSIFAGGGSDGLTNFAFARYQPDGSIDTGFGTGGVAEIDSTGGELVGSMFLTNNRIIGGGRLVDNGNDLMVLRLLTTGSLDATFNGDGIASSSIAGNQQGDAAAMQSDGKIVVAGTEFLGINSDTRIVRFQTDGSLDATFSGGTVTTDVGANDGLQAVIVLSDNKILAGGTTDTTGDSLLLRYLSSGALDVTFSGDGIATFNLGGLDQIEDLALQNDGKVIATGLNAASPVIIRVDTDGTLDGTFGVGGISSYNNLFTAVSFHALSIDSTGKLYVLYRESSDCGLLRVNTDGSADTSFSEGGFEKFETSGVTEQCLALAIQSDGKVLAGGLSGNSFMLLRFLP